MLWPGLLVLTTRAISFAATAVVTILTMSIASMHIVIAMTAIFLILPVQTASILSTMS